MAAKKIVDRYYLDVEPDQNHWRSGCSKEEKLAACKRLYEEIIRHCDVLYVQVKYDSHFECEFCGAGLGGEDDYGCCDKSQEEHDENTE